MSLHARSLLAERPLLIVGAFPSRGAEICDLAADIAGARIAGFVETAEAASCGGTLEGLPILLIEDLGALGATHCAVCAGSINHRLGVWQRVADAGLAFATIVHPSASVSAHATLGEGTVVSRTVAIAVHARLGRHVYVNRAASIGHHTEIDDFVEINPGATIAGQCRIGRGVTIGAGAVVVDRRTIGAGSFVCAGAIVTKDVPEGMTAAGSPARFFRGTLTPEF